MDGAPICDTFSYSETEAELSVQNVGFHKTNGRKVRHPGPLNIFDRDLPLTLYLTLVMSYSSGAKVPARAFTPPAGVSSAVSLLCFK